MRSKMKKIQKTRGHRVERKHVPLCKQTNALHDEERSKTSEEDKHCQHQQWEGIQDGSCQGGKENQEEQTQTDSKGDSEDSKKSIHPGPIQTVSSNPPWQSLPEDKLSASGNDTQEETIEAEQLL
jgi:hypothetical protein